MASHHDRCAFARQSMIFCRTNHESVDGGEHITKVAFLIRARSVVQVHPGPPFKSPVNTRQFSLFLFRGISLKKPICQLFANFPGIHKRLHGRALSGGESLFPSAGIPQREATGRRASSRTTSSRGNPPGLRDATRCPFTGISESDVKRTPNDSGMKRGFHLNGTFQPRGAERELMLVEFATAIDKRPLVYRLTTGNRISCVGAAGLSDQGSSDSRSHGCFSLSLQPLTQSLLRYQSATPHADCGQVFVLNGVIEEPKRKASHFSGFAWSIRHSR